MKMKEIREVIESAPINEQFKKLASTIIGEDNPIVQTYASWKKKAIILTILFIIPGVIYIAATKGSLNTKIRNAYKDCIKQVVDKYAEGHPEVAHPQINRVDGYISREVFDPEINELKKMGKAGSVGRNWGKQYSSRYSNKYIWDEGQKFENPKYKGKKHTSIFSDNKELLNLARTNLEKMQSGSFSENATGNELGIIAFDLYRYAMSTKVPGTGYADAWFTRTYLRSDLEMDITIKGIDLKVTNYTSILKHVIEVKGDDGKVRNVIRDQDGVGGLLMYGKTNMALKGDIVLACKKNLLSKPEGPFLGVKLEKDPFESIDFNRNYELAVSRTFDQISLFRKFSARLVNKLDELREQFPGFAFSVKKDGTFAILIGAYRKKDVPFSLDNPSKFAKDSEYAADIIKSDLIYLNSAVKLIGIMDDLKLVEIKEEKPAATTKPAA